ncbi:hypothetical protein [Nesterenkonia alkaliphila]|uniref:Uncharacterized protein n=1 Tax=Nesterenkonia alkaliphila TaxID=1463631 RepID=A0A7K1UF29_9MICC|nr:hypothetical protein [Nesterenkonia alkaliphila]MVT25080.1 hypothetical protein [Nesterenkonia alkaliphila]GFZ83155.1 hypothetical protein GCM10011359_09810 [Nesterenkonia alkaliphila]
MSPTPDPQTLKEDAATLQAGRIERADFAQESAAEATEAERSRLATDPDPTLTEGRIPRGRTEVEWVRPTDLAARGAGGALGRSTELAPQLHAAVTQFAQQQRGKLQQRLAERGAELEPTTVEQPRTPVVGRDGVSR